MFRARLIQAGLLLLACFFIAPVSAPAQTTSVLAPPRTESQYRPLEWSYFGTGGGGCVQEVAAAPSRPDRMYASIDVGGTYISDDGGLHWRPIYAPLSRFNNWATRPYCIAVSYQDPDVFYFVGEMGPFTSRDGGRTYQRIGEFSPETYNSQTVCINPADDHDCVMFFRKQVLRTRDGGMTVQAFPLPPGVGALDMCQAFYPPKGAEPVVVIGNGKEEKWYRTADGGAKWTSLAMEGWPGGAPTHGPENHFCPLRVSFDQTADKPLLTMPSSKNLEHVYRSTDLGDHWRELPLPPNKDGKPYPRSSVLCVFPHPTDPNTYGLTRFPAPNHITRDGGKTWFSPTGIVGESPMDHNNGGSEDGRSDLECMGFYFPMGAPERVYVMSMFFLRRSDDGGRTFTLTTSRIVGNYRHFVSTGMDATYLNVYTADPNTGYRYISDDDGGPHRSEDFCRTLFTLEKVTTEPADSGHFKAGQGIWNAGACATMLIDSAFNPSRIYAWFNNNTTVNPSDLSYSYKVAGLHQEPQQNPLRSGLYVSTNHGEDFLPCSSYKSFPYRWAALTDALAMDPRSPKDKRTIWIAVPAGVFRSDDSGHEWVCLNDKIARSFGATLPPYDDGEAWDNLSWGFARVRLDPLDGRVVYAHLMRHSGKVDQPLAAIIKSTDNGETWKTVESPVKSCPAFEVSPLDPQRLYAADENLGLFISTDGGKTWANRGFALGPDRNLQDTIGKEWIVRIWPSRRHRDLVFVGVDSVFAQQPRAGVFRSADNGQTWLDITGDIPHLRIMNVKEDDLDPRYIYAGTMGGGGFLAFDRLPMPRDGRASLLPVPAAERPRSYILNGSFEVQKNGQPADWSLCTSPARNDVQKYLHLSKDNVKDGEWSLMVDVTPKDLMPDVSFLFNGGVSSDVLKARGKTLVLSGWIFVEKGADPEPVMFRVCTNGLDAEGRPTDLGCAINDVARGKPGEWTRFKLSGVLDAQKPIRGVWMQCGWNTGKTATTQYVDDLRLVVKEDLMPGAD